MAKHLNENFLGLVESRIVSIFNGVKTSHCYTKNGLVSTQYKKWTYSKKKTIKLLKKYNL